MPKLIIVDCDGVLTPKIKTFNHKGKCLEKDFCDGDRTFIKLFKARGDTVCMLSGDPNNKHFATNILEIDFWYSKVGKRLDKLSTYNGMNHHYKVPFKYDTVVFIGDCIVFDGPLCNRIRQDRGWSFCPLDAHPAMDDVATRLNKNGGYGVLEEVYEQFYPGNYDIGDYAY